MYCLFTFFTYLRGMKYRVAMYLFLVVTLFMGCGEQCHNAPPTPEGFDITGVWMLIKKTYPEGYSYAYSLNPWTESMIFSHDGTFYFCGIHEIGNEVFVVPLQVERFSLTSSTLYIEKKRAMPFQAINDTTITTEWNNCTETWRKATSMTEMRKKEILDICRNAHRNEDGYIINDWVHSTSERKLENTIDKYRGVVVSLGIFVVFIVIYSIEVTKRKRRAEQNLRAIKEELELRPTLVNAAIRQVESDFFQSDYYQALRARLAAGENLSDVDWQEMEYKLNTVYMGFSRKLRSLYDFSNVEFQVCMLVKLGVANNDIAAVINRAPNSVSSIRGRLYKKVLGANGGAKEWDDFVLSL